MSAFWKTFLKGLVTVLPILVTLYVIYWIGTTLEFFIDSFFKVLFWRTVYFPGMGLIFGIVLLYLVGVLVERVGAVQKLSDFADEQFEKIPFVKTLYGGIRDLMQFFATSKERRGVQQVVLVTLGNDIQLIGFVTGQAVDASGNFSPDGETIAVYLPMSYQIGGYTAYVPRSSTKPLDMTVEEAMKTVLTGGVGKPEYRRQVASQ